MQVKLLRVFRKIHRTTGAFLFIFFFVISISGLLLGWKKNSGGIILPKSAKGSSTVLNEWISLDSLKKNAFLVLKDSLSINLSHVVHGTLLEVKQKVLAWLNLNIISFFGNLSRIPRLRLAPQSDSIFKGSILNTSKAATNATIANHFY